MTASGLSSTSARTIDVEATFTDFIRAYGGEVGRDLFGASPDFANADYVFRSRKVVAELKRLVEDKSEDAEIRQKISSRFRHWVDRGLVPLRYGRFRGQLSDFPLECQREILAIFAAPLRRRILKANKQIKSTLGKLGMSDGQGMLIIANDGNFALDPEASLYLIGKVLGRQFRNINSIVYFTVNMLARLSPVEGLAMVWIHGARDSVPAVDYHFVDHLFAEWRAYLGKITNQTIELLKLPDRRTVAALRFQKPARR
jgi:hypothetical protein